LLNLCVRRRSEMRLAAVSGLATRVLGLRAILRLRAAQMRRG
jgi:hypothetical protein